ncbi:MAG: thioredoxin family protein [Desulfuromonas sp.]|nr:MAG: thioredoxin family protein [Desulfuromonas sp.]
MRIDILCKPERVARGEETLENVRQALERAGVEAEVHLFRDRRKMIDHRVYVSPALLVDDDVRIAGRVPTVDEIFHLIAERPRFHRRYQNVA